MSKISIKLLEVYLKRFGWKRYETRSEEGEKEGLIITGWERAGGEKHPLIIDPIVEKEVLRFEVPKVLSAPIDSTPSQHLLELLIALGQINYQIIIGKFSYDPRDGEVRFSVTLPTDKNTLTYEQFEHCMRVITTTIEQYHPLLKQIVEGKKTHRDVGEESDLRALLRRLLEDLD